MAEFHFSGLEELELSLTDIAEIPTEVADEMLGAMAGVVVTAQRRVGTAMGVHRTGMTLGSIKAGKPKSLKDGTRAVYVTAAGSRKRGNKEIRNVEIAFVNEFGRPARNGKNGQKARPFMKTANEQSAEEATNAGAEVYDAWLKSKNL